MICVICDATRPLIGQGVQGREITITPSVKVWMCDTCVEAVLLNASRKAFHERYQEVMG